MADELNAFTDQQVLRLSQVLNWFESNGGFDPQPVRRRFEGAVEFKFGKPSSNISADASGAITEWTLTGSTFVSSTDSETAFDWFGTGANSTDKVAFWRHQASGEHVFALNPKTVIANTIAADEVWITNDNSTLRHLQPWTSTTVADSTKVWRMEQFMYDNSGMADIFVDDGGHVLGAKQSPVCWFSPWVDTPPDSDAFPFHSVST